MRLRRQLIEVGGQLKDQLRDKEEQVIGEGKTWLEELAKKLGGPALHFSEWVSIAQDAEAALKAVEERVSGGYRKWNTV